LVLRNSIEVQFGHNLKSWREELVDKRFINTEPEIGMRRIVTIKDNDKLQNVGLYLSKYKEKWKRSAMKYEEE
jgi:hypothetical protein